MTKPQNTLAIEEATKVPWTEWVSRLRAARADTLAHTEIVALAQEELRLSSQPLDNPGWWAQTIAVAYEQEIGRRKPGQKSDGSFEVSVSKTFAIPPEILFKKLIIRLNNESSFNNQQTTQQRSSITPKRSYWRCTVADTSKVTFAIEAKTELKSLLVINHSNLTGSRAATNWRRYWKDYVRQLEIT